MPFYSKSLDARLVLFIIATFLVLFAPKISIIDFSVITLVILNFLLFAYCQNVKNYYVIGKSFLLLMVLLGLVAFWTLLCILINQPDELYFFSRTSRAVLNSVLIFLFYFTLTNLNLIGIKGAFLVITAPLVLHAFVIFVQIIFPQAQELIAPIVGFNKSFVQLRAFGLTAGYDTAGIITSFAAAVLFVYASLFRSRPALIYFLVCGLAVLLTSRTSMFSLGLFLCLAFMTVKGVFSTRNLYVLLVTFGALSLAIAHYVLPIFFSSIFEFENIEIFGYKLDSQYAMTKLTTLEESQLIFPTDMWTKIFGTGEDAEWSDIGYVKVVYMGGWVLLCLYVVFYLFIFFRSHKFFFKIFSGASHDVLAKRWREVWKYIILSLTIMMLFSNIKNLYFLTRIYHELFIVVFSLAAGIYAHNARVSRNYTLNELK